MLTPENIALSRLQNQQISQRHLTTVEQIVAWHGAGSGPFREVYGKGSGA